MATPTSFVPASELLAAEAASASVLPRGCTFTETDWRTLWLSRCGRTFVLGSDPLKHKMQQDVGHAFAEGKRYFNETPNITSSELFDYAKSLAEKLGWKFGGPIAGHLIGQFPHER